jgi:hypothetical protein
MFANALTDYKRNQAMESTPFEELLELRSSPHRPSKPFRKPLAYPSFTRVGYRVALLGSPTGSLVQAPATEPNQNWQHS